MAEVTQRVVIITGCSTGIGLDTAVFLAKNENKKYKVYACMRNLAKKEKLLEKAGDCVDKTLFILEMDVKSESSVNAAIKHVLDTDGKVDVLSKYNIVHVRIWNMPYVLQQLIFSNRHWNVAGIVQCTHDMYISLCHNKYNIVHVRIWNISLNLLS